MRAHYGGEVNGALLAAESIRQDDDVQLTLFVLYGLHYGFFPGVDESLEWQTYLVGARRTLEIAWETELRDELSVDRLPTSRRSAVASELAAMAEDFGSELAVYMA
jgi:hypothetical protein